ncbi:hypothetical protein NCAS_0E03570 [Naumovozyma castellii]|uniref:Golgi to ER traffic protein 2 n=1 Tax=Naumovozyma castellii TaxID=27288 RepID=G0VG08_NAUCA|nr:hypothetical protein NCAS_0E03570 [Naumovozyma castellii CBS 4309]CCC70427.1 hypothetical protein NCAS_0E03570 [Naumovozyma castellii CBS 4309]
MSELSESEKRRILRERRQKKFAQGGATSRLNKITGQAESHLSTESPLDTPKQKITSPVLETVGAPREASIPTTNKDANADPQVELLKKLADMQNQDQSTPDLFSLLGSLKEGMNDNSTGATPVQPVNLVDQEMLAYHDYLVNRLKAFTILIKWLVLLPYIYFLTKSAYSSAPISFFTTPSNFFMIFTSFEIIATSIYYQKLQSIEKANKVNTMHQNSKIVKLVSLIPEGIVPIPDLTGKVVLALQYWDVLSMFITDICFVIIAMGLCSYFV